MWFVIFLLFEFVVMKYILWLLFFNNNESNFWIVLEYFMFNNNVLLSVFDVKLILDK